MKTRWSGTPEQHTYADSIILTNGKELNQEEEHKGQWIYSIDYQQGKGAVVTFWQERNRPDGSMSRLWIPEHQIARVYFETATTEGEHRGLAELKKDQDAEERAEKERQQKEEAR